MQVRQLMRVAVVVAAGVGIACGDLQTPTEPTTIGIVNPTNVASVSPFTIGESAGQPPVAESVTGTVLTNVLTAQALTVSSSIGDGWSSITGFRRAETAVQRQIVHAATASDGLWSGQSMIGPPWVTDAADGDGERMRRAIRRYADYLNNRTPGMTLTHVQELMKTDLTTYDAMRRQMLVNRMIDRWNVWSRYVGPLPFQMPPRDDQQLLYFMGIRRQCLEWVDTIARNAGGRALNYSAVAVPATSARPGMGLFNVGAHAMIITDVEWRGGVPVRFKVAEANNGGDWMNSSGQVPWERTVNVGRLVAPGYKIVSFE
jgi:hypothetical protein